MDQAASYDKPRLRAGEGVAAAVQGLMRVSLKRHPESKATAAEAIEADVERTASGISLRYTVTGDMNRLAIPEFVDTTRADELWRWTCFEIFIRPEGAGHYFEYNFSPSGRWAAYRFNSRRSGMANVESNDPGIGTREGDRRFDLRAELNLSQLAELAGAWSIGISVIIEQKDGAKAYWAIQYPAGPADFHHADCFALRLAPAV